MSEVLFMDMNMGHLNDVLEIERLSFTTPWSEKDFIYELTENRFAKYRVILIDKKAAAYGGMWLLYDEAHITNIAVHPEYRGTGLGNAIVMDMIERARESDIKSITLEVRRSNTRAINLYKKWGFEETAVRKGYYQDTNEDALIMWKYNI